MERIYNLPGVSGETDRVQNDPHNHSFIPKWGPINNYVE